MANRWIRSLALLLATLPAGVAAADPAPEPVDAVWKPYNIRFEYRAYSTIYTCGSRRSTLETILETLGAREDLQVKGFACDETMGLARFQIAFNAPVEATSENVHALTRRDEHDALIARVRGERLADPEDLPRFPAVWRTISFARDRALRLRGGDCELVQQVRRQVLSRMSVRIVNDRVRCSSFGNISPPRLTVSALVPLQASAGSGD
jgi:hypothetical protein